MNGAAVDTKALRVVVIDDTEDLRELLRIALERGGMQVVGEAGDGRAGIETVRAHQPDVVLLDLSMPVMDGLAALPHLRVLSPDAKIIVLSGFGANQMAERALATGADGYLQKGMSLAQILERVQEIVLGPAAEDAAEQSPPAPHAPATTAWDALALSPYGVLEVEVDPPFRILHANPAAARLLEHEPVAGSPLESAAAEIARLAAAHLGTRQESFSTTVAGRGLRVAVRQATRSLLLYLEASSDEIVELRRTVATAAHEIRGPVAVLNALAETITHHTIADRLQRDRLMSSVARQAKVLDGITGDLLVTAQAERGALRIEPRAVDPAAAIEAAIADQSVPVALEVHDRRPVLVDPLRLDQMIGNLVRNAVKYGRPPIVARIRGHADDDRLLEIDVEDRGSGVPEEFRSQLFHEFARAAGTTASGIGLGLHVVRTLAEAHGGSVSYAPVPEGGAVFTLTLPAG